MAKKYFLIFKTKKLNFIKPPKEKYSIKRVLEFKIKKLKIKN
jgi:hypothetical protein